MTEQWVLNASPLIALSHAHYEGLLFQLIDRVIVPRAVANEVEAGPADDPARRFLAMKQVQVVEATIIPAELLTWDLGAGETGVLAYALAHSGSIAILDDGAARRCARSLSVPVKGTLGIILLARQRNIIPSAAEVLRILRANGFRLDDAIIANALYAIVGETW